MRRSLALSLVLSLFAAANVFAGAEARLSGKILDAATKKPIPDAVVKLEAIEGKTVKQEHKAKKDGGFAVFLLDGTIRYKFTFEAPGYAPYEEVIKLKLGEPNVRDFELIKAGSAPVAAPAAGAKPDPAVEAYNTGASLSNSGDYAGAMAKFQEAVAAKPDLTAGWMALAKVAVKTKNYPVAIEAAKKALEIDDSDVDMWSVLFQSYTATGDKANAAIAEKKLPANAPGLFNQAARLINEGKDGEAENVLKQAVAADEKFAVAWYELGMVYVRTAKSAEAKEAFNKYLALEPNGKDAPTAKEMLNYLK
ncbi:MAG TPA: tetratricopeptide repeat protein [Thermoanaerobaculia bacterium]|jgi:tetratricopeptide (TPR) repeat protein|nr:tetratricopeptide repeat protein [Thermoanaerobaculia bacterium]